MTVERGKAVEFSVFTLADSGAFATHAPRRLNEALALVRPFRLNVWPIVIATIALAGPIMYLIIAMPYWWSKTTTIELTVYNMSYINEMVYGHHMLKMRRRRPQIIREKKETIPDNLLFKCIWFVLTVFLKQGSNIPFNNNRTRFIAIVLWFAATYVLSDVYSAQLTSQFARPASEQRIDNLYRLKNAMENNGYKLYVERQSGSLALLENGTSIFGKLYSIMRKQKPDDNRTYLVPSVEHGIRMILENYHTVVLGGRETLYFNCKRYGIENFQLSEKLFTRYSAVAVQFGCPFLDSLNEV